MKLIKFIKPVLIVLGTALCTVSYAQYRADQGAVTPVKVGSVIFNLGIGVGSEYKGDYYNSPFGTKLALEWGLWQAGPGVVTLGLETGGSFSNGGYYSNYKTQTIVVAGRAAWHYGWNVRGLDTYGGFSAGIGFLHYQYTNQTSYSNNEVIPVPGAFVGASYFVTPRFGFNAEAGYDITNLQIGLIFKLR